jgi:ABC-2 type transport system ATP-binding protein
MNTQNGAVVAVRNLVKQYPGVKAVDDVSFDVHQGEIFGMAGPNGVGKTTTIECVEGLRQPDSGSIQVLGLDPQRDRYPLRERIGVQFQSAALPHRIKVWEALDLFAAFYRRSVDWQPLLEQMGWVRSETPTLPSFPAGRNSGSLSRWRWSATRNWSFWTN